MKSAFGLRRHSMSLARASTSCGAPPSAATSISTVRDTAMKKAAAKLARRQHAGVHGPVGAAREVRRQQRKLHVARQGEFLLHAQRGRRQLPQDAAQFVGEPGFGMAQGVVEIADHRLHQQQPHRRRVGDEGEPSWIQ